MVVQGEGAREDTIVCRASAGWRDNHLARRVLSERYRCRYLITYVMQHMRVVTREVTPR